MDISKTLEELEDKYYGEWEENRETLIPQLANIHQDVLSDPELAQEFRFRVIHHFGGAYIPYVFWEKLADFMDKPDDERTFLQETIRAFTESDFDAIEQKKMKPLLVVYLITEKDFELNKLNSQVITKTHPSVKDYFQFLHNFVTKNARATAMYLRKFEMLKDMYPDFEMLDRPIPELEEEFE